MGDSLRIGVDGGGTKTECILVDSVGQVVARHLAPGCNPSVVGADQARLYVTNALNALLASASTSARPAATLLCMAGSRTFWRDFGQTLTGFGSVVTVDDSLPVLELATEGQPGLVLHAGTGSFIAARVQNDPADLLAGVAYAGGLGWRFGDPGSGYDLGRRTVARGLLELQGWEPESHVGPLLRNHTGLTDAAAITRLFYTDPAPNQKIAALAAPVLRLAAEGDPAAREIVTQSVGDLASLAERVAKKLFPDAATATLRAGLSGSILTHPAAFESLVSRSSLPLRPVTLPPSEGVRRLLARGVGR